MDVVPGGFAAGFASLGFFGGIALLVWAGSRSEAQKREVTLRAEAQKRELEHRERLKALELGQPLPDADLARAAADRSRAIAAAVIGTVVPLVLIGAAVGTTAFTFAQTHEYVWRVVMMAIVWGVTGLVNAVTVILALVSLRRGGSRGPAGESAAPAGRRHADSGSTLFTDKPASV